MEKVGQFPVRVGRTFSRVFEGFIFPFPDVVCMFPFWCSLQSSSFLSALSGPSSVLRTKLQCGLNVPISCSLVLCTKPLMSCYFFGAPCSPVLFLLLVWCSLWSCSFISAPHETLVQPRCSDSLVMLYQIRICIVLLHISSIFQILSQFSFYPLDLFG